MRASPAFQLRHESGALPLPPPAGGTLPRWGRERKRRRCRQPHPNASRVRPVSLPQRGRVPEGQERENASHRQRPKPPHRRNDPYPSPSGGGCPKGRRGRTQAISSAPNHPTGVTPRVPPPAGEGARRAGEGEPPSTSRPQGAIPRSRRERNPPPFGFSGDQWSCPKQATPMALTKKPRFRPDPTTGARPDAQRRTGPAAARRPKGRNETPHPFPKPAV